MNSQSGGKGLVFSDNPRRMNDATILAAQIQKPTDNKELERGATQSKKLNN